MTDIKRAELLATLAHVDAASQAAARAVDKARRDLHQYEDRQTEADGVSLRQSLRAHINGITNSRGIVELIKLSATPEWRAAGIRIDQYESVWPPSDQFVLTVGVAADARNADFRATSDLIDQLLPALTPGALDNLNRSWLREVIAFQIRSGQFSDARRLVRTSDGTWSIRFSPELRDEPLCRGSLISCLRHICDHFPEVVPSRHPESALP